MTRPSLDHPTLPIIKEQFPDRRFYASEFRGETTVVAQREDAHALLHFLRHDERCQYDFLADVVGIDYLNYPGQGQGNAPEGRFAVVYCLTSYPNNRRLFVKVPLEPTMDTFGKANDPALVVQTVTDIWPGAEWMEREVFDMFGIKFSGHPDHRRILLWDAYPHYPLRKDYPVEGRGEREDYRVIEREQE